MEAVLAPYRAKLYATMRIVVGFLFMCHGLSKVFGLFGGGPAEMNALLWVAGIIELVGGALVMIGFQTSIAAFISSGQMAVAYFMAHQPQALFPIENKGELAALYCWVFLYIASRGDGPWSVGGPRK